MHELNLNTGVGDGTGVNHCREFIESGVWVDLSDELCRDGIMRARTMVFIVICVGECVRSYTVRNTLQPVWHRFFRNRVLFIGNAVGLGLMLLLVLAPGVGDIFGLTHMLPLYGWLLALGSVVFITVVDELFKRHVLTRQAHMLVAKAST